jgi:hypothetical protein
MICDHWSRQTLVGDHAILDSVTNIYQLVIAFHETPMAEARPLGRAPVKTTAQFNQRKPFLTVGLLF